MIEDVDVILIGSGQGGNPLARDMARAGRRVVAFEREHWGGTCVNDGCTPSKALLASAHNAGRARGAGPLGVHCDVRVDAPAVFERVRAIRKVWRDGSARRLEKAGVEMVEAHARFTDVRTVSGGDREVRAPLVFINVGGMPALPWIDGLEDVPFATNETIFDWKTVPERTIVLGGGYIGLELGQALQRLGSRVTLVNFGPRVMEREEEDATTALQTQLESDGMRLIMCCSAKSVRHDGAVFSVTTSEGTELFAEGLLVATGRMPNTRGLDAHKSNVEVLPNGLIKVDEYLKTTCEGVYALGDAAGQPQFTHVAYEDYRRITSTLAGRPRTRDDRVLSYTTFTEPQIARAGLTEAEARAKGIDARSATLPLENVARGTEWGLELGFYRMVIDRANDKVIGATMVGYETGELIHVLMLAIERGLTWRELEALVWVHPTFAEGFGSLAALFDSP